MALFLYAVLNGILVLGLLKNRSRFLFFILGVFPFLFLFTFFWWTRDDYRILQIHKHGYQFEKTTADYRHPSRSISIGGNQSTDQLFLADLPENALALIPSLSKPNFTLEVRSSGILITRNDGFLNAMPLQNGDRIQCAGGPEIVFNSRGSWKRSFSSGEATWNWPNRSEQPDSVSRTFFGNRPASSTVAISQITASMNLDCSDKAAFLQQPFRFTLSRQPVRMQSIYLIGAGKELTVNGAPVQEKFDLNSGDEVRVYVIQQKSGQTGLMRVGNWRITNQRTFDVILDDPETLGMKEELLLNGSSTRKPLLVSTSTLPYSVFPSAHFSRESRSFGGLFAFVQTLESRPGPDLKGQLDYYLSQIFRLEPNRFEVVTEKGVFHPTYGDLFPVGEYNRILFSIRQVQFPWILLGMCLALIMLKMLFQPPFLYSIRNMAVPLLILTVDFFLASRLIFAYRAESLYPFSLEAVPLALLALLLVPYLILSVTLLSAKVWNRSIASNLIGYSLLILVLAGAFLPHYFWLPAVLVPMNCLVAFLRFHPRSPLPKLLPQIQERMPRVSWDAALLIFFIIALLLQIPGTGEAIHIGGIRFPMALIYHPAFLLFGCYYTSKLYKILALKEDGHGLDTVLVTLAKLGFVFICFIAISFLTFDLGFLLLYCTPLLFLLFGIGVLYLYEYQFKWKGAGSLMSLPLVLFLTVFTLAGSLDELLPISATGNRYFQRILLSIDPSALEDTGLISAEKQLGHQRTFLAYSRSGVTGAGYMKRPISSALSATALNDNVPSALLLNDFGVAGFLSVLIIFLLLFVIWRRAAAAATHSSHGLHLSLASLITWIFVGMYMLFANSGIFLFTGKNVFLWGLNSISDLFHSVILVSLITVPLVRHIPAESEISGEVNT